MANRLTSDPKIVIRHSWKLLANRLTSDPKIVIHVTSENYWEIASRVTKKSLFTVTHALFFIFFDIYFKCIKFNVRTRRRLPYNWCFVRRSNDVIIRQPRCNCAGIRDGIYRQLRRWISKVYVCVWERKRERESVCVRVERERVVVLFAYHTYNISYWSEIFIDCKGGLIFCSTCIYPYIYNVRMVTLSPNSHQIVIEFVQTRANDKEPLNPLNANSTANKTMERWPNSVAALLYVIHVITLTCFAHNNSTIIVWHAYRSLSWLKEIALVRLMAHSPTIPFGSTDGWSSRVLHAFQRVVLVVLVAMNWPLTLQ